MLAAAANATTVAAADVGVSFGGAGFLIMYYIGACHTLTCKQAAHACVNSRSALSSAFMRMQACAHARHSSCSA